MHWQEQINDDFGRPTRATASSCSFTRPATKHQLSHYHLWMAVVQSMGKPTWVRTGLDLTKHFMTIVENKSSDFDEFHIIFDRCDVPNSMKEWTQQLQQWEGKLIACNISDEAVIKKVQLKQLLNSNENKDKHSKYLESHILETNCQSEQKYVTMIKDECKLKKLNLDHLKTKQEKADTQMCFHVLDGAQRDASSICIQSPDTDVLVLALWCYKDLCPATSLLVSTGRKLWII